MKYLGSTIIALGALAFATTASAAVVCNDDGDCWKVKERHAYPPGVNLQIYGDDWDLGDGYRWREPGPGRGFYRGGVWVGF